MADTAAVPAMREASREMCVWLCEEGEGAERSDVVFWASGGVVELIVCKEVGGVEVELLVDLVPTGGMGKGVGGEIGCAKDVAARKMIERRIG